MAKSGDSIILCCEKCGTEEHIYATWGDNGLGASLPRNGWYFSAKSGWLCPKHSPPSSRPKASVHESSTDTTQ